MSRNIIPLTQQTCTTCLGVFYRAMETELFVFFVNFLEGDENGQVKMYRKEDGKLELVSDNYFASVGIHEEFHEGSETWMSSRMKRERQLQIDEFILPLVKEYVDLSRKGDIRERFNELEQEIDEYHVSLPDMDVCLFLEDKFETELSLLK